MFKRHPWSHEVKPMMTDGSHCVVLYITARKQAPAKYSVELYESIHFSLASSSEKVVKRIAKALLRQRVANSDPFQIVHLAYCTAPCRTLLCSSMPYYT